MCKQLQNIWTSSYILKTHLSQGRWHRYLNLFFNWSLECAVTLELLIPVFWNVSCGVVFFLVFFFGSFICLEVLLWKEFFYLYWNRFVNLLGFIYSSAASSLDCEQEEERSCQMGWIGVGYCQVCRKVSIIKAGGKRDKVEGWHQNKGT